MLSALETDGFASDVQVWHMDVCDSTYSCVWHAFFVCVSWLMHMCDMTHLCHCLCVWHKSWAPPIREWISLVWLFHISHDSFICVMWLKHVCRITHSTLSHDSFKRVTWLTHVCHLTHSRVSHASSTCVTWISHDSCIGITWLIHMYHMKYSYVSCDSFICVTWLDSFIRVMFCCLGNHSHCCKFSGGKSTPPFYKRVTILNTITIYF